jgi:hypothetical protein
MPGNGTISWPRITTEAAAIVGSILLAFAIDAWWDERQLRAEEQEILRGLKGEFEAIHATLARDKAAHLKRLGYFEALLIAMEDGSAARRPDLMDAAVLGMLSLRPPTSAAAHSTLCSAPGATRFSMTAHCEPGSRRGTASSQRCGMTRPPMQNWYTKYSSRT